MFQPGRIRLRNLSRAPGRSGNTKRKSRSPWASAEGLLRFVFPERPGALLKFLSLMRPGWNISLFHYRNHGADYGRILVGLQVPPAEKRQLREFLDTLGYRHWDESDHPAYRLFLGAQI